MELLLHWNRVVRILRRFCSLTREVFLYNWMVRSVIPTRLCRVEEIAVYNTFLRQMYHWLGLGVIIWVWFLPRVHTVLLLALRIITDFRPHFHLSDAKAAWKFFVEMPWRKYLLKLFIGLVIREWVSMLQLLRVSISFLKEILLYRASHRMTDDGWVFL